MAKDTWPDLSTRQGFIEAIEQAGQYIRDHASNLLGEYPSLLCEFDITARFRFDAVPTVEIRREHIAAPLDEYQQRRAGADSVEKVCRDMYREIIDHDAKHPDEVPPKYVVRKLMPVEFERLQGFPDGWTEIDINGKPASDTARYKALGNSMAVPVMRWIGERIAAVDLGSD